MKHGGLVQIPSMLKSEMPQNFQFPSTLIKEAMCDDSDKVTQMDRDEIDLLRGRLQNICILDLCFHKHTSTTIFMYV